MLRVSNLKTCSNSFFIWSTYDTIPVKPLSVFEMLIWWNDFGVIWQCRSDVAVCIPAAVISHLRWWPLYSSQWPLRTAAPIRYSTAQGYRPPAQYIHTHIKSTQLQKNTFTVFISIDNKVVRNVHRQPEKSQFPTLEGFLHVLLTEGSLESSYFCVHTHEIRTDHTDNSPSKGSGVGNRLLQFATSPLETTKIHTQDSKRFDSGFKFSLIHWLCCHGFLQWSHNSFFLSFSLSPTLRVFFIFKKQKR